MLGFYFLILLSYSSYSLCYAENNSKCSLPKGCRIDSFYFLQEAYLYSREFFSDKNSPKGFVCEIKSNKYRFDYDIRQRKHLQCDGQQYHHSLLELRFKHSEKLIIDETFNLQAVVDYLLIFNIQMYLHFTNLQGFDIELGIRFNLWNRWKSYFLINVIKTKISFYGKNQVIKSCQDLKNAYGSDFSPNSLFQLRSKNDYDFHEMLFLNCEFK